MLYEITLGTLNVSFIQRDSSTCQKQNLFWETRVVKTEFQTEESAEPYSIQKEEQTIGMQRSCSLTSVLLRFVYTS